MTKTQLIALIARRAPHVPSHKLEAMVNAVFDLMADALLRDERIELRGFGCFSVRTRKARAGRNPKTGEPVSVPERKMLSFTAGKELRERIEAMAPTALPVSRPAASAHASSSGVSEEVFPVARTGSRG